MSAKVRKEHSYGCVVAYRKGYEDLFLIVRQKDHWGFPKGHPIGGEFPVETARREVMEECSVAGLALMSEHVFTEKYSFEADGWLIEKQNTFFLAVSGTKRSVPQAGEILECGFFTFEEAYERLTYEGAKKILTLATEVLEGIPRSSI